MNRYLRLSLAALLAFAPLTSTVSTANAKTPALTVPTLTAPAVATHAAAGVIVRLKAGVTMGAAARSAGQRGEPLAGGDIVTYPTPAGLSPGAYAAALRATGRFSYVSPNYILNVSDYTATPNDPDFSDPTQFMTPSSPGVDHAKSWALRGTGSARFDQVWSQLATDGQPFHARVGGGSVPVAEIDTGFGKVRLTPS